MDRITIEIKNKNKLQQFMDLIKELDYVEVLNEGADHNVKEGSGDLFSIAGICKEREIDLINLREKAWRKRI
ncbi:hypothetical protein BH23BAC3_BH23BAC3_31240 [soil metagenome]